ncbi:MAG TPA: hypothetical protein VEA16_14475 [Vicinamibacterales bacterium]|nr:hypothetical protein [Vicinamibacterales bacterium]
MYFWLLALSVLQPSQDRVIGLLSLPQVFGSRACAPFEPRDVPLHSIPDDSARVAVIRVDRNWSFAPHGGCDGLAVSVHRGSQRELLPTLEYDYEMPAAIVLEQRSGWFRVRVETGSAWVKASVGDRFMSLGELFEEFIGMTRIDDRYTGRLLSAPGVGGASPTGRVAPGQPVQVLELRDLDGRSFVRVDVMSHSLCAAGAKGPPEIVATGWLPLHAETGEPTIWYSSRGC